MTLKLVPCNERIPTQKDAIEAATAIGALLDYPVMARSLFNPIKGRLLLFDTEVSGDELWHRAPRAQTTSTLYADRMARSHGFMIDPEQYRPNFESQKPKIQFGEEPRMIIGAPTLKELLSEYSSQ